MAGAVRYRGTASGPKESCKAVLGNSLIMGLQKYFEIDFSRMESFIKRSFKNVLMGQNVHSGLWILIKAQNKMINRVHGVLGSSVSRTNVVRLYPEMQRGTAVSRNPHNLWSDRTDCPRCSAETSGRNHPGTGCTGPPVDRCLLAACQLLKGTDGGGGQEIFTFY